MERTPTRHATRHTESLRCTCRHNNPAAVERRRFRRTNWCVCPKCGAYTSASSAALHIPDQIRQHLGEHAALASGEAQENTQPAGWWISLACVADALLFTGIGYCLVSLIAKVL